MKANAKTTSTWCRSTHKGKQGMPWPDWKTIQYFRSESSSGLATSSITGRQQQLVNAYCFVFFLITSLALPRTKKIVKKSRAPLVARFLPPSPGRAQMGSTLNGYKWSNPRTLRYQRQHGRPKSSHTST